MKIKKIYIAAFGGLKNFSIDFTDGFNTVYGENENGKSTVMAFIKMMFYGSSTASGLKNMRNRYSPWDGSDMAGSITFEHSGRMFRLEREFKKSNSTDKVVLFDLDMGTKEIVASDIGTLIFGISASAFEHSIFIGSTPDEQMDKTTEGEINAKLSNLSSSGDESVSFTEIFSRIEKARLSLNSKSGKAGILDKNKIKLKEYDEAYVSAYEERMHIKALKEKEKQLQQEISSFEAEAAQLKEKMTAAQDMKNSEKLKEMLSLKADLDKLNKNLALKNGKYIDDIFVRSIMFGIGKIENAEQKVSVKLEEEKLLKSNIELLENPSEDMNPENAQKIAFKLEELKEETEKIDISVRKSEEDKANLYSQLKDVKVSKKSIGIPMLIPGIVLILAGIGLLPVNSVLGISPVITLLISAAGFVLTLLSFLIKRVDTALVKRLEALISESEKTLTEQLSKMEKLNTEESSLREKFDLINTVLNNNTALIEKQKSALNACREEILQLLSVKEQETEKLLEFYSRYKQTDSIEDIKSEIEALSNAAAKQKELKQQLNYIVKDLGNISYDEAGKKLAELKTESGDNTDISSISSRAETVISSLTDKKNQLAAVSAEIKVLEKSTPNPDEINAKMSELKETIAIQNEFCEYSKIAMDILTDSFAEFRRSYGSVLEQNAAEIFKGLTQDAYSNMSISKSFDINVEKTNVFGSKEIDYLSSGTKDQVYLSMRLALARLMTDGDALPVFLDDSLDRYDDTRVANALDFLNRFAQNGQVIMFTCHSFISDKAKSLGSNVTSISK